MFLSKKSENIEFWKFSDFLKSRDFAGFLMENWLHLGPNMTDFDSKTRFEKYIKFS
jgi:hypothetical protein